MTVVCDRKGMNLTWEYLIAIGLLDGLRQKGITNMDIRRRKEKSPGGVDIIESLVFHSAYVHTYNICFVHPYSQIEWILVHVSI